MQVFGGLCDILVASTGEVGDEELVRAHVGSAFDDFSDSVSGLERGNEPFHSAELHERVEGLRVCGVSVFYTVLVAEPGVLWSNGCIVKAGGHAVSELNLASVVLKEVGARSLEHA
jgi:hypothetical protein